MSALDTIYISIAAYRDPQLVPTIEDCLAKAKHPERLRFGICWQHGPEETSLPWADDPRFRIMDVDWKDSRGACWARAELMARYEDETYFMQLDSHHRFAREWDEAVIAQLERTGSPRPVLTAYATPFNPEDPDAREYIPMQMNFDRFTDEGIILFRPGELDGWRTRERPARARFLSAHFLFTIGAFVRDVPYDPDLYFIGEEITLAVRAYTHGYDFFHPTEVIVWHEYTRDYREHKHWTDHTHEQGVEVAWHERDRSSLDRVRAFLEAPTEGPFGLGRDRTFQEYEAYAGVNFRRRRAQEYTRRFEEPPNPPAAPDWADRIVTYALDLVVEKTRLRPDVHDYHFWYVGVHDEQGLEIQRQDLSREEVRTLLDTDEPHVVISRSFETDRVPASWTVWPVSDSQGWLEKIEGPIYPQLGPVTFVTALLDLGRDGLATSFARSFEDHYLPLFERLLRIDVPLVVFVAPEHEAVVWRHRDPINTRVITMRREDLEQQPWFGRVQDIRRRPEWLAQASWLTESPQAALPHYNPLVLSKMRLLARVAAENPFGTTHAFWIDAGLVNTVPEAVLGDPALVPRLAEAADGFLWVEYPYRDGQEVHGFPRTALARRAGVGGVDRVARGGFFGGATGRIAEVAADYDELLASTLAAGEMGTEESLFTILAYRDPGQFVHYLIGANGLMAPFFEAVVRGQAADLRRAPAIWLPQPEPSRAMLPPDPDRQARAAEIERGTSEFMGLPMMQSRDAVLAFDALWRHLDRTGERVARIVYIGVDQGGLATQLYLFALGRGAEFVAYDAWENPHRDGLFRRIGLDIRVKDTAHEFVEAEIARFVQGPGLSILICDGVDKPADVRRFAPYLKTGDLVMAHDYAPSFATFEQRLRGRLWNWCELTDEDIRAVIEAHQLEPVLPDVFGDVAWMCRRKRGTAVERLEPAQGTRGSLALYVLTFNAPDQLALWFESVALAEPELLSRTTVRVLLDNSTDESTQPAYEALAGRYGFEHVRLGNIGILGGRAWCAHHFTRQTDAEFMVFFEDDMLLHVDEGRCRNGFPTRVPGLLDKALAIIRNEPGLGYLKLSYTEFYGDHRQNWAYFNLDAAGRERLFPAGHATAVEAVKSHEGLAYMLGEVYYSNWPMLVTRAASDLIFADAQAARFEQSLMVRALELQRAGRLRAGVLLASPINHNRVVHYGATERTESHPNSGIGPAGAPVTFVTAVYCLSPDDALGGRGRSLEFYFTSLRHLAMFGAPFVIYTAPEHAGEVEAFGRTLEVPVDVRPFPLSAVRRYAAIQALRDAQDVRSRPYRDRCHVLCFGKLEWLGQEARAPRFGSGHVYWLDAGLAHAGIFPSRMLSDAGSTFSPSARARLASQNRILLLAHPLGGELLHDVSVAEMVRATGTAAPIEQHVVGGLFGGPRGEVTRLAQEFDRLHARLLEAGLLGTEENVLSLIAAAAPPFVAPPIPFNTWYHDETDFRRPQEGDVPFHTIFEAWAGAR